MSQIADLNNYSIKKLLDELINRYESKYQKLLKEFQSLPDKTLCISKVGNYTQYRAYDINSKSVTGINSNKKLIAQLCRREVVNLSLKHIKIICDALNTIKKSQEFEFVEDLLPHLKPLYSEMDILYFMSDYESIKKWLSQPKDNFRADGLYVTNQYNESFRSKTEILITNALHKHNIPYIYMNCLLN